MVVRFELMRPVVGQSIHQSMNHRICQSTEAVQKLASAEKTTVATGLGFFLQEAITVQNIH